MPLHICLYPDPMKTIIFILLFCAVVWLAVSNGIQAIECPHMTQTELFLRLPQSFIGEWRYC